MKTSTKLILGLAGAALMAGTYPKFIKRLNTVREQELAIERAHDSGIGAGFVVGLFVGAGITAVLAGAILG